MADDVRASIDITTSTAEANVVGLEGDVRDLDTAIDKVDGKKVDIPFDAPGAADVATKLDRVDQSARRAGGGAQVGTQHVSDLAGAFGPAGSAASTMGQAVEGAGGIVEGLAGSLGLSESATGKLTATLGIAAVAVGAAAAAWEIYNQSQKNAQKGLDETRSALGKVYDKLKEGDTAAAASTFVETMGGKIEKFQGLFDGKVSMADVAGALFGDPQSIKNVETAIDGLDSSSKMLATSGLAILRNSWDDAKKATDANTALQNTVEGYFQGITDRALIASGAIDDVAAAYGRAAAASGKLPTGGTTPRNAGSVIQSDTLAPSVTNVTNVFQPPITPLAVQAAQQRQAQTQSGFYPI